MSLLRPLIEADCDFLASLLYTLGIPSVGIVVSTLEQLSSALQISLLKGRTVTSQKDQIQRLITEIDAALAKPSGRLPLGLSGDAERQRQLLGKLHNYLQSLKQMFESPGGWGPIDPGTGQLVSPQAEVPDAEESAAQVLQGLLLEMQYLKDNSLKPMRQELEVLQQKRDSLQAEINVLEAQRDVDPIQSEQQLNAFLENLMQRLQEQLSAQMVQNLAALEAASVEQLAAAADNNPEFLLSTGQRLEQVRLLQAQSDQLLLKLDTTLTAVFGSLQKSIDSYRESLEEGLDQMHGLGRQGEAIFHAFVNHLAQQLGQDASLYLTGELSHSTVLQEPETSTELVSEAGQSEGLDQVLEELSLENDLGIEEAEVADSDVDADLMLDEIAPLDEDDTTFVQVDTPGIELDIDLALFDDAIASMEDDIDDVVSAHDDDINLIQSATDELDGIATAIQSEQDDGDETELVEPDIPLDSTEQTLESLLDDAPASDTVLTETPVSAPENLTDAALSADAIDAATLESDDLLPFNLDTALGDIDQNLGLLAMGSDTSPDFDQLDNQPDPDVLSQLEAEGAIFALDAALEQDLSSADIVSDADAMSALDDTSTEAASLDLTPGLTDDPLESLAELDNSDIKVDGDGLIPSETPLLDDASQITDDWLLNQAISTDADIDSPDAPLTAAEIFVPEEDGSEDSDPSEASSNSIPPATIQSLFEAGIEPTDPAVISEPDEGPIEDTIESLSELLPDEQGLETVEDFPIDVPDDVYIAASPDEDLINLVESGAEQRLLIDFDDGQLVEQLDEDLQKLAGDNFSADYGIEEDALEPLDQKTLETIVQDLNLEDLDLDSSEAASDLLNPPNEGAIDAQIGSVEARQVLSDSEPDDSNEADLEADLFEGFTADAVGVDNPSDNTAGIDDEVELTFAESELETAELDLLSLANESLTEEFEEFDDGLTDSLADELIGLNEQSNVLSQDASEEIVGQYLSDLEEPVITDGDPISIPEVDSTEPRLDSASVPDLPIDSPMYDASDLDSPEADDFLQAEQEAFWRTMAEEMAPATEPAISSEIADIARELDAPDDEEPVEPAVEADIADLLLLDELPSSSVEPVTDSVIDLGDLDDLFGQTSVGDLESLSQLNETDSDNSQTMDPLAELGLEVTSPTLVPEPAASDPEVDELMTADLLADESVIDIRQASDDASTVGGGAFTDGGDVSTPLTARLDLEGEWFLGLDVGSTGLSAVLMERLTGQIYPLYWQTTISTTKHFRLPAVAMMTSAQETVAVGYDALGHLEAVLDATDSELPQVLNLNRLKPLLKVAVGHGDTLAASDPWLRWSDKVELPMLQVLQAMVALLKSVVSDGQTTGLKSDSLKQVWDNLQGVVVGYPTNWPDTYSFNLREAVLAAGLVDKPEQVLFVEDAIATVLSGLPDPSLPSALETVSLSRQPSLYNCQWAGGTVIISGGATMTELGLVNLSRNLTNLNYSDFALRGFAYAGDALDQDIVCQLLLPEERRQPLTEADSRIVWDWQGHLADSVDWSDLQLDTLKLPAVGHIDWGQRYQLQQRLLSSSLGQSLLAAARHLKLALQQQNQVQISLAGQRWLIKRRHLENLIFLPYVQRINRYLNVLLNQQSVDAQTIKQVICTGGSASLPAIARWLRQKFPNATIIQDTYASELPQSCSRVAYGLVNLARYSQVLNVTRQQYSDYFLLMELLRVFPQQPLPVGAIMHLLEQRGINTQACQLHILALLEGHLPPGLVPTTADRGLISDRTNDLSTYRALLQTPLFTKTVTESGGQIYIPNQTQAEQLRSYFNQLLIDKVQTLEEPLIAHLEALV